VKRGFPSLASVCLGLLAGCKVGPNYHPPQAAVPAQWASPLAGGETNQPAAKAEWWKAFHDPELDSLIARSVRSNLDLHAAAARVREARAARGVAAAGLWPSVNASGSYANQRVSPNGPILEPLSLPPNFPFVNDVYQAGFDAAWELDVFGGTRRAVEAANADITGAEYGRRNVLLSLLSEVARNYMQARGFQRRLVIARLNIRAQRDVLTLTQDRLRAGLSSQLDVEQASALLASTEAQVPVLETGFKASAYHLGVLLGQPPGAVLEELAAETPIPASPPEVPVGLPSDLLLRRPDIRQAERALAAATARIGVAVADLFPKFSLTGNVGVQSVSPGTWFTSESGFWSAGPTVQWRIFDAGRIRSNIRVQNARQEQALAHYEQTVLVSFEDVENALTAYAKEQIRRQSLAAAAHANQEALEISRQNYRSGLADFLNVLESERSLYQTQDALVQSELAVSLNVVALYKALGGGWENGSHEVAKAASSPPRAMSTD
jgi:outer membrane protein, multidrug efflux system